jgi:hypothetical protein
MASSIAFGARTFGDVRVAIPKSTSTVRTARATARPVAASVGRVTAHVMPGAVASRGVSLKVSAARDRSIETNSTESLTRVVQTPEQTRSSLADAPAKKFAVPALAFAAAVAAMSPAGPAAAAAAAVATINQADTAWVLISTGTSITTPTPGPHDAAICLRFTHPKRRPAISISRQTSRFAPFRL